MHWPCIYQNDPENTIHTHNKELKKPNHIREYKKYEGTIILDPWNGILLLKLFWLTARKSCSSDWEKLLKFEAEGWEFAKILRSLEQFMQTVKGENNFW